MDYETHKYLLKNARTLKTIGWCGFLGIGFGAFSLYKSADVTHGKEYYAIAGGILVAGSIITSTYCFIKAHKVKSDIDISLQSSTLYQHNFEIGNGSTLSAGIDLLNDRTMNQKHSALACPIISKTALRR